jgi:hypothetical protein
MPLLYKKIGVTNKKEEKETIAISKEEAIRSKVLDVPSELTTN